MKRTVIALAAFGWLLTSSAPASAAVRYHAAYLGNLDGYEASTPYDISESGFIVGCSTSPYSTYQAFLYQNGNMLDLGLGVAYGVNNLGQAVGATEPMLGEAFFYDGQSRIDLGPLLPPHLYSRAYSINDAGDIVGSYTMPNGWTRGFLYSDGVMTDLGGGISSCAYSINNRNSNNNYHAQATGSSEYYNEATGEYCVRPFIYSNGSMTEPPCYGSGHDINEAGVIVGRGSNGDFGGAFYSDGVICSGLGSYAHYQEGRGINDRGEIVGIGTLIGSAYLWPGYGEYPKGQLLSELTGGHDGGVFFDTYDIDNKGQIIAYGHPDATSKLGAYLLTPVPKWKGSPAPAVWEDAANWDTLMGVPQGVGVWVTFGNQDPAQNVVDMASTGQTIGGINFDAGVSTTLCSSGGFSLTLDNGADPCSISVEGSHTISAPVVLNSDLDIDGDGTLTMSGGISGEHTLHVMNGELTASSIRVSTLIIGGNALDGAASAVPEPSVLTHLAFGMIGFLFSVRTLRKVLA